MKNYDHNIIEKKWQITWTKNKVFTSIEKYNEKKYYCLVMLPYPSGTLHMGHVRNYTIGDVLARFHRMNGENVLHPMGWDAFGLPAENAAIANDIHPAIWTKKNIICMKHQLKSLGISYDWEREVTTCNYEYYKWNQWFFIKMFEKGLAFRKTAKVNWCKTCNTVLANEQVINGKCWRCSQYTEYKNLKQWFIKITNYADELIQDSQQLSGWPNQVIAMQNNWIGKSIGLEINFKLTLSQYTLKIFTTRPDTIYGVTFIAISQEHNLLKEVECYIKNYDEIMNYISKNKMQQTNNEYKDTAGIMIEGIKAINPINGNEIPIFIADYVLIDYGTGGIMAVPAHDKRDWNFAKQHNIPIIEVIKNNNKSILYKPYEGDGILINSDRFNGLTSSQALAKISKLLKDTACGKQVINFKIRDWLISRQRYWGTPIPIIYCNICGMLPVPVHELPVILPKDIKFSTKTSTLKTNKSFINVKCPKCQQNATRETDTMDTFIDSAWYYARYCDPKNMKSVFNSDKVNYWMPVNQYIGGIEHACMHLVYARFWYKVMRDLELVKTSEPFSNLLTQGMVTLNGKVMSKSKGNTVSPDKIIKQYGADSLRLFILFAAPPQKQLDWTIEGLQGCRRFIKRLWNLFYIINVKAKSTATVNEKVKIVQLMHTTIKKVTYTMQSSFKFNTAIANIMELVNSLYVYQSKSNDCKTSLEVYKTIIILLYPFTPHICEELWEMLGYKTNLSYYTWPSYNCNVVKNDFIDLPIQINGKVRGTICIPIEASQELIKQYIISNNKIATYLKNKTIIKFIYVKKRIVTIVIK
ncbi:MAG: leucine--tRNA ligase [Endomicrobium sp.]|jgi:leucyl-tRNA synthetase|nr:leucine--tRNA ligase [Endomicrobium sp.]